LRNLGLHIIIFTFWASLSYAQDLHYSQFYNSPLNISPALTGIFNGDKRVALSARDQWRSVPVPWLTFSGSYDQKFYKKNRNKNFFGGGVLFNYDRQGDSKITLMNVALTGTYNHILTKKNILTLGAGLGYASRGFNQTSLSWDKQWNGDSFDPSLPSGENITGDMISMVETNLGVNYRFQEHDREHYDFGIAVHHILQPSARFSTNGFPISLPRRYSGYAMASFPVFDNLNVDLSFLHQSQNSYNETLFGALVNLYVNRQRGKETNLHVGVGYRTSESLFPKVAIEYGPYYVGLSYDVDLSRFNTATDNKGGPELHFKYTIKSVKPLGLFKACPIF